MKSIVKDQVSIAVRSTLYALRFTVFGLLLGLILLVSQPVIIQAAEVDLKPGDTIGPHNWQKIKDMVGPNFLERVKQGYTFQIKESKKFKPPREYVEATEKYSGAVKLGSNGYLENYVLGLPFPKLDPSDPKAGEKLAWNFYWRWLGDNYKTGGATKTGQIIRYAIEKNGDERRSDLVTYTIFPHTQYTLDPKRGKPGSPQESNQGRDDRNHDAVQVSVVKNKKRQERKTGKADNHRDLAEVVIDPAIENRLPGCVDFCVLVLDFLNGLANAAEEPCIVESLFMKGSRNKGRLPIYGNKAASDRRVGIDGVP